MTSKKLLVLDVNGLLVDTYFHKEPLPDESPDARVGNFFVYKRPFCEEFLQFCLENFIVGVWSSAREYNVNNLVDYVFGGTKEKLAFSWHQSDCTDLGLKSPDNQLKPLFLKELSKLWRRVKLNLPWSEGNYGPSNTLLVDDTPYKAILNPPNTAIFPRSYTARDREDNFLCGALRSYLEGIRDAASVQTYVESNPFGEPSITPSSPLWSYVNEVLLKMKNVLNKVDNYVSQIMPVEAFSDQGNKEDKIKRWHGKWMHHSDPLQPVEFVAAEDHKEDKRKRWRNRKRGYFSDSSHLANSNLQSSDFDSPSEVVEPQSSKLQSSDYMCQLLGSAVQAHDSIAYQQVDEISNVGSQEIIDIPLNRTHWVYSPLNQTFKEQEKPSEVGRGINLPSRLEEPLKDAHQDRSRLSTKPENLYGDGVECCKNTGLILSRDLGDHRALLAEKEAASTEEELEEIDKEHEKEIQAIYDENHKPFDRQGPIEEPFTRVLDAGIDAELNMLHEQQYDDAHGNVNNEEIESSERLPIPVGDEGLKYSESYRLQVESNKKELFCGRREMGNNNFVRASNNKHESQHHLTYSSRHWDNHRGSGEDLNKRHSQRNDSYRRSFNHGQGRKSERGHCRGGRGWMPFAEHSDERRHHFANKQHRHSSGKGHQNRNKPSSGFVRLSDQRWCDGPPAQPTCGASIHGTRSWDQPQQDCRQFSNMKTSAPPTFGALDKNIYTWPLSSQMGSVGRVRKYNEYGQNQDGGPSCYLQQGLVEQRPSWPERTGQLNVGVHNPESNLAVQAEARGNGKRQRRDFTSKGVGASSQPHSNSEVYEASSQPHRNVGVPNWACRNGAAFSQPYRGRHGSSRQTYYDVSASSQLYHNSWDNHRQGLLRVGSFRSRQNQEVRNL